MVDFIEIFKEKKIQERTKNRNLQNPFFDANKKGKNRDRSKDWRRKKFHHLFKEWKFFR